MPRPDFCPCEAETPDQCPACGATVSGNDPVRGVCQARAWRLRPSVQLVLIDKQTGEIVASTK
jgi:hypothetical protein